MFENIKSFTAEEVILPAPVQPLIQIDAFSAPDDVYSHVPRSAGEYQVFNAIVDRDNRIGTWSLPETFISEKSGWMLYGSPTNLKPSYDSLGVAWKIRCLKLIDPYADHMLQPGEESILCVSKNGTGPASIGAKYPWGRMTMRHEILVIGKSYYQLNKLKYDGSNKIKFEKPFIKVSSLPNRSCQVAYAWMNASSRFSEMSPPVNCGSAPGGGGAVERRFLLRNQPIPPGAVGYRLFVKLSDSAVFRPESRIVPIDNLMPVAMSLIDYAEADSVARITTVIDPIQVAIKDTNGDVIIPDDHVVEISNPIIDIYDPAKFGRTIGKVNGGRWKMVPYPGGRFDTSPVIMIQNQKSRWVGMEMDFEGAIAVAGISFSDYSGGQAFGTQLIDCNIKLDQTGSKGNCQAIRVIEQCAGGGHSASEVSCVRCDFAATEPIWLEHKQTCNWVFRDCGASAFISGSMMNIADCVAFIGTPNLVRFDGIFHCDCPSGTIFATEQGSVECEQIFVDKGCVSLIDFHDYRSGYVNIKSGTVNFNQYQTIAHSDTPPNLVRGTSTDKCQAYIGKLKMGDCQLGVTVNGKTRVNIETYGAIRESREVFEAQ